MRRAAAVRNVANADNSPAVALTGQVSSSKEEIMEGVVVGANGVGMLDPKTAQFTDYLLLRETNIRRSIFVRGQIRLTRVGAEL